MSDTTNIVDQERWREAGLRARAKTNEIFETQGPTLELTIRRLKQALNAKIVKVFYDSKEGQVIYSKNLIDHTTRLRAVALIAQIRDLLPTQRMEHSGEIGLKALTDEQIDQRIAELTSKS